MTRISGDIEPEKLSGPRRKYLLSYTSSGGISGKYMSRMICRVSLSIFQKHPKADLFVPDNLTENSERFSP